MGWKKSETGNFRLIVDIDEPKLHIDASEWTTDVSPVKDKAWPFALALLTKLKSGAISRS